MIKAIILKSSVSKSTMKYGKGTDSCENNDYVDLVIGIVFSCKRILPPSYSIKTKSFLSK